MALLLELITLALKPLSLAIVSCQFGARSIWIVIWTWVQVLRFAFFLHFVMLYRLAMWAVSVLSLPLRALNALYRERLLEMQLHRLKNELENVLWDRKELEERLHVAMKERRMMEMMLMELEEEHDEAIVKLQLLKTEVQDLKDEVQRYKEIQGKAFWNYRDQGDDIRNIENADRLSWKPESEKDGMHSILKMGSKVYELRKKSDIISGQKEIALSRSLFSAVLSLVVGIIAWEAKDPCMPLVVALLTVVSMSLVSVLQLFITIEHKPASDVVALLSLNWFILGALAYPTLPMIARVLAPVGLSFRRHAL